MSLLHSKGRMYLVIANDLILEEDKLKSEKFLDDYGTYTEDGYMAPKHLYADISDILPPRYQDEGIT